MQDKELADAMVALDLAERWMNMGVQWYRLTNRTMSMSAQEKNFVRDPRVAMALMEKMCDQECDQSLIGADDDFEQVLVGRGGDGFFCDIPTASAAMNGGSDESLPRAIVEACVEALR